jgi:hypothetical protein
MLDEALKEIFERELSEVFDDYPEITHGAATMTAAERTMEVVNERIERIADNRKWGHIEEVNKAHFGG